MSEGPPGGHDSRSEEELPAPQASLQPNATGSRRSLDADAPDHDEGPGSRAGGVDTYALYQRGLDLLGRGSAAAAGCECEEPIAKPATAEAAI